MFGRNEDVLLVKGMDCPRWRGGTGRHHRLKVGVTVICTTYNTIINRLFFGISSDMLMAGLCAARLDEGSGDDGFELVN